MVEHQPSKLDTWVRFPSPALLIFFRKMLTNYESQDIIAFVDVFYTYVSIAQLDRATAF